MRSRPETSALEKPLQRGNRSLRRRAVSVSIRLERLFVEKELSFYRQS